MMYAILKGLQCIIGRFRTREPFRGFMMWERNVHSLYNKEKGLIDSVITLFNLCPKVKKVLNKIWQSSSW